MTFRLAIYFAMCCAFATSAAAQDFPLSNVLIPGENWQLVSEGHQFTEGPAADAEGNVFFVDVPKSQIFHVDHASGKVKLITDKAERTSGLAIGPDGTLYGVQGATKRVVKYNEKGEATTIAEGIDVNDLAVGPDGGIYVTDFPSHAVWYVSPKGEKRIADKGIDKPNGLTFWPDGKTLVVGDFGGNYLHSFRVEADGNLAHKEGNYMPQLVNGKTGSGADGIETDSEGRLYAATHAGLQVFDRECRLSGVILKPQEKFLSNVCFGGPKFDYLYVTCQDKVYRRLVKTHGLSPVKKQ